MPADSHLLPAEVQRCLKTACLGRRMYYLPEVDSTNRVAKDLAGLGERDGTLVLTDFQSAGRGRREHRWLSPPGRNLLFSLILRPDKASVEVLPLTLTFSLVIAELLSNILSKRVSVKWPNDVVVPDGKMSGILSESTSRSGWATSVIVGIGVNVNMRPDETPSDVAAASCYSVTGREHDRQLLLAELLNQLEQAYDEFLSGGFKPFVVRYRERLTLIDKSVHLSGGKHPSIVRVVDVDDTGGLVVQTHDDKLSTIFDGEVTPR